VGPLGGGPEGRALSQQTPAGTRCAKRILNFCLSVCLSSQIDRQNSCLSVSACQHQRERERDKIVGFHDTTRLATLHNSAMPLGPSHPDTKARCAAMMIRPYKPRYSLYLVSRKIR